MATTDIDKPGRPRTFAECRNEAEQWELIAEVEAENAALREMIAMLTARQAETKRRHGIRLLNQPGQGQ